MPFIINKETIHLLIIYSIQVIKSLASRAYTNNLPLALEPIWHYFNTHRPSVPIMLQLRKRLC